MAKRDRPHIVVPTPPQSEPFTSHSGGGDQKRPKFRGNRRTHGEQLAREYEEAWGAVSTETTSEGIHITFTSFPNLELAIESLEERRGEARPELVAVREISTIHGIVREATVYVPSGKKEYFLKKLDAYVRTVETDQIKHSALVDAIHSIKRATIRELWTDPDPQFPTDYSEVCWWEIWLRRVDGKEQTRLTRFASVNGLKTSEHYLGFGDRTVVLLQASADQLAKLFETIDDIAELRKPHEISSFLPELNASEQREWVDELLNRVEAAPEWAPVVCVLDRGVQSGHPLLSESLTLNDLHSADPRWNHDPVVWPHGTEMAGLALYGDLHMAILDRHIVRLGHRLESVKILPDRGANDPDLYGAVTARAVDQPEITNATRKRVFMLAVTANAGGPEPVYDESSVQGQRIESGRPTAWSATIDALSFGRTIDDAASKFAYLDREKQRFPRLFVVSAGNIRDVRAEDAHLDRSDAESVEDPAQAWNAISVGAYSEHDSMAGAHRDFAGYVPIAAAGELSPVSRTSVSFDRKHWPFKPEVVASGGNLARTPDGTGIDTPPNLGVLTTRHRSLGEGYFTTTRDTSAATAQVAAIAADIYAAYPNLRPETVRALIVHSAEWTDVMRARFDRNANKSELVNMLRRYGMGVPSLDRAIYSATDALTLVAESSIRPYEREGNANDGKTREMNLHQLPWPTQQLEDLGDTKVRLRVTLSYFIEPNPSSRGWTGRYIYPSHGLRFAMKRPDDGIEEFRRRTNKRVSDVEGKAIKRDAEPGWLFGSDQQQSAGSLHTDIWTGKAIDLASKGAVAVYPVAGWWKNRKLADQSDTGVDYSLVVSIESPEIEVDLWTPVAQQLMATIQI